MDNNQNNNIENNNIEKSSVDKSKPGLNLFGLKIGGAGLVAAIIGGLVLLVILIAVVIGSSSDNKEEEAGFFDQIIEFFTGKSEEFDENREEMLKQSEIDSFNLKFANSGGIQAQFFVSSAISNVLASNSANEKQIAITYDGVTYTTTDELTTLSTMINAFDTDREFTVTIAKDDEGYINLITLVVNEEVITDYDVTSFNMKLNVMVGVKSAVFVAQGISDVISSNGENDRQVTVDYNGTTYSTSTELLDLFNIIDAMAPNANLLGEADYDEHGFITKIKLTLA